MTVAATESRFTDTKGGRTAALFLFTPKCSNMFV